MLFSRLPPPLSLAPSSSVEPDVVVVEAPSVTWVASAALSQLPSSSSVAARPTLQDVPDGAREIVASYLDCRGLAALRSTCQQFRSLEWMENQESFISQMNILHDSVSQRGVRKLYSLALVRFVEPDVLINLGADRKRILSLLVGCGIDLEHEESGDYAKRLNEAYQKGYISPQHISRLTYQILNDHEYIQTDCFTGKIYVQINIRFPELYRTFTNRPTPAELPTAP